LTRRLTLLPFTRLKYRLLLFSHISRGFVWLSRARITRTTCISLTKWSKVVNISQNLNKRFKTTRTINIYLQKPNLLQKTRGVWKLSWAQNWARSVVTTMRFSDQLPWKWRHMASKSAMFLATLFWLTRDRSRSSSYYTAQWCMPIVYADTSIPKELGKNIQISELGSDKCKYFRWG
jgi:hypothetical protein